MKLSDGEIEKSYTVDEVRLPLALERRLEALGILPGTQLHILNKKSRGTLIIFVRGTRFAVGRGITENILVEEAAQ